MLSSVESVFSTEIENFLKTKTGTETRRKFFFKLRRRLRRDEKFFKTETGTETRRKFFLRLRRNERFFKTETGTETETEIESWD